MAVKQLSDGGSDGTILGQGATDKVALYGKSPVAQRAGAAQAVSLISAGSAYTTAERAALLEVMNTLTALGLWKGSA